MSSSILVIGATGNVGKEVVKGLRLRNADFAAAVKTPSTDKSRLPEEVAVVEFDFLNPSTFAAAFKGVRSVFLVRPPPLSNVKRDLMPALQAAKQAGVVHIVFLSLQGAEANPIVPHHKLEKLILQLEFQYTFLRPSFFMQNLSTTHRLEIRDRDEIAVPAGEGKTSFIDVRDLAEVGVQALCDVGHTGRAYELTGLESPSYAEVAAQLSVVLGRKINYTNPSLVTFIWQKAWKEKQPIAFVLVMSALYTVCRFGKAGRVTPKLQELLGRKPRTLMQFMQDTRALWIKSAA